VIVLEMADDGRDGRSASDLSADGLGDAPDFASGPDLEPVRIVVAAIALVAVDAADLIPVSFSRSVMTAPSA
jgi:hypothetical protein